MAPCIGNQLHFTMFADPVAEGLGPELVALDPADEEGLLDPLTDEIGVTPSGVVTIKLSRKKTTSLGSARLGGISGLIDTAITEISCSTLGSRPDFENNGAHNRGPELRNPSTSCEFPSRVMLNSAEVLPRREFTTMADPVNFKLAPFPCPNSPLT